MRPCPSSFFARYNSDSVFLTYLCGRAAEWSLRRSYSHLRGQDVLPQLLRLMHQGQVLRQLCCHPHRFYFLTPEPRSLSDLTVSMNMPWQLFTSATLLLAWLYYFSFKMKSLVFLYFTISWLISSLEGYWKPFEFSSQPDGLPMVFRPFQGLQSKRKGQTYRFSMLIFAARRFS